MKPTVDFRDNDVDPAVRDAAERSVLALVENAAERTKALRELDAERSAILNALNEPLQQAYDANDDTRRAFDRLRDRPLLEAEHVDVPRLDVPLMVDRPAIDELLRDGPRFVDGGAVEVTVPPNYDFFFSWSDPNGGTPFGPAVGGTASVSGYIGREARSGGVEGGANKFVFANAGYGIFLSTDRPVTAIGRSFKKVQYSYSVAARGVGTSATSEGGLTFSVWRDGAFVTNVTNKMWRKRVSGFEEEGPITEGPYSEYEPSELAFAMEPGHNYIFQVEAWVFSDASTDIGWSAARSLIKADVLAITLQR